MPVRAVAACPFCVIVAGDEAADEVYRDDLTVAFLDRRPLFPGHVLVVPTRHVETLPGLDATELAPFFAVVQRLSTAVPEALGSQGTFVAMNNIVSQSVPHLHVHVVPRTKGDGLRGFFWPRTKYAPGESAAVADRVRHALADRREA